MIFQTHQLSWSYDNYRRLKPFLSKKFKSSLKKRLPLTRKICNIRIKKNNIGYWNVFFDFLNEFWLDEKSEYEKATWNFRHYRAIYIIMFMQLFFDDLSDFSHILNYFMTPIPIFHRISLKKLV